MIVDFNSNADALFAPVFYALQEARTRYVLNYGGSASAKSYSQHQLELMNLMDNPIGDTLIMRKHATTIHDSSYVLLKNIAESWGVKSFFKWRYSGPQRDITAPGGRRIFFKGIDDPEKVKSLAGVQRIVIEEASELHEADWMEIMRRTRGMPGIQIVLLFNPIDENHWIKKMFFDSGIFKMGENLTVIRSSYLDNPFLYPEDLQVFELMKQLDYNQYRVYALAEWGVLNNKNPWLYAFSAGKHVSPRPLSIIPNMPVHLSFDFNVNPLTCIAAQHTASYGPGSFIRILKEYALPDANVGELVKRIKSDFPLSVFTATGDATGRNRNAGYTSGSETIWNMVQKGLNLSQQQILTPLVNPSHKNSRFLSNLLLQQHPSFLIDPSCKGLIHECLIAKPKESNKPEDEDKLFKETANGEYGMNLFDCFRYYNSTHFHNFAKYVKA